jgi:hypothetical protein
VADTRCVCVVASLAEGTPLAEQIPALVEADLDRFEPALLALAQATFPSAFVQLLFFGNELLDAIVDSSIVHLDLLKRVVETMADAGRSQCLEEAAVDAGVGAGDVGSTLGMPAAER